jgi:thiamine kinase-like enzyme
MNKEKKLIQKYYKEEIKNIEFIDSGWHNKIYLINNKDVARLSFTEYGKLKMNEYYLIQDKIKLPLKTPHYTLLEDLKNKIYTALAIYPYFKGYKILDNELNDIDIKKLSKSISNIHSLDFSHIFIKPIIKEEIEKEYHNLCNLVYPNLLLEEKSFIDKLYCSFLDSKTISDIKPVFVHGDINDANLIIVNNKLSALIDWDGIHYNDPMLDFSRFYIEDFYKLLKVYPNKEQLGDNIFLRYLFYRIRKHTYAMYYPLSDELYTSRWQTLYERFKNIKKELEPIYSLLQWN